MTRRNALGGIMSYRQREGFRYERISLKVLSFERAGASILASIAFGRKENAKRYHREHF
jgi:hypothetical protein